MPDGKLWTQRDRYDNEIYLTHERWSHITEVSNHPELAPYLRHVRETIKHGSRRQHPVLMNAYKYYHEFGDLPNGMNHIVVVVVFNETSGPLGVSREEKFVVTAYLQFF